MMSPEIAVPTQLKPLLKWAGSKRWLIPRLRELYAPHRDKMLVEPFVGGMSVALGLMPARAKLADSNRHLINFHQAVRQGVELAMPWMLNDRARYYEIRAAFNAMAACPIWEGWVDVLQAKRFWYLNRTGFNGLCRFNRKGEANVPFGRYKSINYNWDTAPYKAAMRDWRLLACDFRAVDLGGADGFVYSDPPYAGGGFVGYQGAGFRYKDQIMLAGKLAAHRGPVVASNAATPEMLELYGDLGFRLDVIDAPRRIACNGDRRPAKEMLATRNL